MDSVAVAGAAGFIGSHVVERLREEGLDVVCLDRPGADLGWARALGARSALVDLRDGRAGAEALAGARLVVNATGLFDLGASPRALEEANVEVTRAVAGAARRAGARRLVHLSSVAVYGLPARAPLGEEGPFRPRNAYERSKLAGERAAIAEHGSCLEVVALRPTLVYGPRARYGHAMMIALAAQARALGVRVVPLPGGGPLGHHVHVRDVAEAVRLALFAPDAAGRALNVADARPLPVGDSMRAIARAFGLRAVGPRGSWRLLRRLPRRLSAAALARLNLRLARGHRALERRTGRDLLCPRLDPDWLGYFGHAHVYDTARLAALGFVPRHADFARSIEAVVDWYRASGWLPTPPPAAATAPRRAPSRTPAAESVTP
jgi:nucleoside-diphosphate-sugar epimerase